MMISNEEKHIWSPWVTEKYVRVVRDKVHFADKNSVVGYELPSASDGKNSPIKYVFPLELKCSIYTHQSER